MEDVTKYTDEELQSALAVVAEQMNGIRAQLDEAKGRAAVEGDYSDREWFNSARTALRMKGQQHQRIGMEIGRRVREEKRKRANAREIHFVRIAKLRLDPELFAEILEEAKFAEMDALGAEAILR